MCVRGAVRADIKIHPTFGKSTFGKTFSEARAKSIATVIQFDLGFCSTFEKVDINLYYYVLNTII
jgi:hypothetical protein